MVLTEIGLAKVFQRVKSFVVSQLNSKASVLHTHTSSDITDLPNGYVVDSTLDRTSSNAISNSAVSNALTSVLPIGSYIQFAGSQAPEGFLVCNGGAISRTTYSALFAVIGTTYGSGDGSTTFNLPNLTDRFLQGSTTSGTVKNAGLPNLTGECTPASQKNNCSFNCSGAFKNLLRNDDAMHPTQYFSGGYAHLGFDASWSNSIYGSSSTVQPPALTCLICIKY